MNRHAALAVLALSGMLVAAAPAAAQDAECIFDQAAQIEHYREMERRIAGARFVAAERLLIIERGAEQITMRRGGCVHFGLSLTHTAPASSEDAGREAVFARAVALVAEFGGELVSAAEVAAAIRAGAYAPAQEQFYYVRVSGVTAFSIGWDIEGGRLTVKVEYYS